MSGAAPALALGAAALRALWDVLVARAPDHRAGAGAVAVGAALFALG